MTNCYIKKIKPHLPKTYFQLLQSYLSNRAYSVKIENSLPTAHPIKFGVPQGSVLDPRYILVTHDFPTSPHIILVHFGDDIAALCKTSTSQLAALHKTVRWPPGHLWVCGRKNDPAVPPNDFSKADLDFKLKLN